MDYFASVFNFFRTSQPIDQDYEEVEHEKKSTETNRGSTATSKAKMNWIHNNPRAITVYDQKTGEQITLRRAENKNSYSHWDEKLNKPIPAQVEKSNKSNIYIVNNCRFSSNSPGLAKTPSP